MSDESDALIDEIVNASARLNAFYAVIGLLESGILHGGSTSAERSASRIIQICRDEGGRQLATYDKAKAKLRAIQARGAQ